MYSMTGYGQARVKCPYGNFHVVVSSVNHKFRDISVKLPYELTVLEWKTRKLIEKEVKRGKINVFVRWEDKKLNKKVEVDTKLAEKYLSALRQIARELHLKDEMKIKTFADFCQLIGNFPEIVRIKESEVKSTTLWPFVDEGVVRALRLFLEMRGREGDVTEKALRKSLSVIEKKLKSIRKMTCSVARNYARHFREKVRELDVEFDERLFASEIAVIVQRMDIEEEVVRLSGLLGEFSEAIGKKEEVGRKLDFFIQEMNRETNTVGSKSDSLDISKKVIDIKTELQRMREQVQNIE